MTEAKRFAQRWRDRPLTPRQACSIQFVLSVWSDEIAAWLTRRDEPLARMRPFTHFAEPVMIAVNDDAVWAAAAAARCIAVEEGMDAGELPCDRDCCFGDEVLLAAALLEAPDMPSDNPELFEKLPKRKRDADWDLAAADLDDAARWPAWSLAVWNGPAVIGLMRQHPPAGWWTEPPPGSVEDR